MIRQLSPRDLDRIRKEFWERKRAETERENYLVRNNFGFSEILR